MICPDQATLLLVHFYHSFLGILSVQSVAVFCVSIFACLCGFSICAELAKTNRFSVVLVKHSTSVVFYCYGENFSGADSPMQFNGQA